MNNRKKFQQSGSGRSLLSPLFCVVLSIALGSDINAAAGNPVRSASELDYPPFAIVLDDGSAGGFSVELMRAALAAMGRKVVFTVGPWGEIKQKLEDGHLDALPLVGRSPEREAVFDFTAPYIRLYGAVFVRNDEEAIKTPEDLKGHRVGVMQGDNAEEFMRRKKFTDKLVTTPTFEEAMQKLAAGELDAVVVQRLVGLNLIERLKLDNLKTAVAPLRELRQDFCFAVTEGDKELLALLNEGLMVIIADGTYDHLRAKWMGILDREERRRTQLLKSVAGAMSLLALFLLVLYIYQHWKNHHSLKERVAERTAELEQEIKVRKQAVERFQNVLEKLPVAMCMVDEKGEIYFRNDRFLDLFEYTHEEVPTLEQWWPTAYPDEVYRQGVLNTWNEAVESSVETGGKIKVIEYRVTCHDGRERDIEIGGITLKRDFLATFIDNTERNLAREKQRKAKEAAEAASKAKSIFLANMSHELRTPLNAILGFSEMLAKDPQTTADQQKKLAIINRSGEHLLAMINDILDLSKIEAGKTELNSEPFELSGLLEEVGEMIRSRAGAKDLLFSLEVAPETEQFVRGDADKLRQILINLLGNAVKFTRRGSVALRARTVVQGEGLQLELEVEDTGPGIPPDDLQSVFRPFFQSGSSRKGTGLGLAISHSFAELMGGTLEVQSTVGQGSIFRARVFLSPARAETPAVLRKSGPEVIGLAEGQPELRILVVEDNPDNRLLITTLLTRTGFSVREAVNGKEAVAMFETWRPHFIWMDIRMPVMDGYEATRRIRALPGGNSVPVAALTASVFRHQHDRILAAGCDEVVHKPFRSGELFSVMEKYLDLRYNYKEGQVKNTAEQKSIVTAAMLKDLPAEQRERLKKAVHKLDVAAAEEVIEDILHTHSETADGLQVLIREFRFSRILELLNSATD